MIFSLIVATYGRHTEISTLLESLRNQTFDRSKFEVIFVDQNDKIDLSSIFIKFKDLLNIIHIKSDIKGLSFNRNIGIAAAKGKYISFPDDDCTYYTDTLDRAFNRLEHTDAATILGAIRDRDTGESLIKHWPREEKIVTQWNVQSYATSITIFTKNSKLQFCEDLGVGTKNGSCEDLDYLFRSVTIHGKAIYYPDIEVWHPAPEITEIPVAKVASYGRGFGHFCRINSPSFPIMIMFLLTISYHTIQLFIELFRFNLQGARNRATALSSRVYSFLSKG